MKKSGLVSVGVLSGAAGLTTGILSAENLSGLTTLEKVGPSALLVLVVLLVLFGALVPVTTVIAARREADYWREAFFRSVGQVDKLVDKHDVGIATLRSLEREAKKRLEGED